MISSYLISSKILSLSLSLSISQDLILKNLFFFATYLFICLNDFIFKKKQNKSFTLRTILIEDLMLKPFVEHLKVDTQRFSFYIQIYKISHFHFSSAPNRPHPNSTRPQSSLIVFKPNLPLSKLYKKYFE
jgi:hypothetical protein